jgi:hypothetical protein
LLDCTLELTICDDGHAYAELEIPAIDEYTDIGLVFDNGELVDYDGIMSLPPQLIPLIEEAGYKVTEDFIS